MVSFDVKALFTLVLVDPAFSIVQNKLLHHPLFSHNTSISIQHIITLLEFHLKNTYFLFQCKYFEQVHSAAMGSPLALQLPTCSWKSLNPKPLALPTSTQALA